MEFWQRTSCVPTNFTDVRLRHWRYSYPTMRTLEKIFLRVPAWNCRHYDIFYVQRVMSFKWICPMYGWLTQFLDIVLFSRTVKSENLLFTCWVRTELVDQGTLIWYIWLIIDRRQDSKSSPLKTQVMSLIKTFTNATHSVSRIRVIFYRRHSHPPTKDISPRLVIEKGHRKLFSKHLFGHIVILLHPYLSILTMTMQAHSLPQSALRRLNKNDKALLNTTKWVKKSEFRLEDKD